MTVDYSLLIHDIIQNGVLVGGTMAVFSFTIGYGIYTCISTFKHIAKK